MQYRFLNKNIRKNNEDVTRYVNGTKCVHLWAHGPTRRVRENRKKNQRQKSIPHEISDEEEEDREEEGNAAASCCTVALSHNSIEKGNGCTEQAEKIPGESIHHPRLSSPQGNATDVFNPPDHHTEGRERARARLRYEMMIACDHIVAVLCNECAGVCACPPLRNVTAARNRGCRVREFSSREFLNYVLVAQA